MMKKTRVRKLDETVRFTNKRKSSTLYVFQKGSIILYSVSRQQPLRRQPMGTREVPQWLHWGLAIWQIQLPGVHRYRMFASKSLSKSLCKGFEVRDDQRVRLCFYHLVATSKTPVRRLHYSLCNRSLRSILATFKPHFLTSQ
jgi:hypothetical protein